MTSAAAEIRASAREDGWYSLILPVIVLLAWLPGLVTLPALDRDESRFAQASRQMVETGNLVDIRLGDSPRYNKPVGIYWLQAGSAAAVKAVAGIAPSRIWLYRIPSFVAGILALFLMTRIGRSIASPRVGLIGAALLGLTLLLSAESEIATTDAALLATVLAAQATLLGAWQLRGTGKWLSMPFALAGWAAFGAGVLIKGPVIAAVGAATALTLCIWQRDWRWLRALRPLSGFIVAALVVMPWLIAIGFASHGAFFQQSLGHDFGAKLAGGQESHGAPPGYYLALLSVTFWPATLFLLPALALAWRDRDESHMRFLIAWATSSFVMFELVPTKLPHYILPAYAPLALLAALWIGNKSAPLRWQNVLRIIACVQFGFVALAIAVVPFVLPERFGAAAPAWTYPVAATALIAAASAIVLLLRERVVPALAATSVCALLLYPTLILGVVPRLAPLWISERVADLVKTYSRPGDPPLVAAGYAEPSLLFHTDGAATFATGGPAAAIAAGRGGLVLVEGRERGAFLSRLGALPVSASPLQHFSGFDYSSGRKEEFVLYRVAKAH